MSILGVSHLLPLTATLINVVHLPQATLQGNLSSKAAVDTNEQTVFTNWCKRSCNIAHGDVHMHVHMYGEIHRALVMLRYKRSRVALRFATNRL